MVGDIESTGTRDTWALQLFKRARALTIERERSATCSTGGRATLFISLKTKEIFTIHLYYFYIEKYVLYPKII